MNGHPPLRVACWRLKRRHAVRKLRRIALALLLCSMLLSAGCTRFGAMLIARTVVTAAVVATVLHVHDAHYHHVHCGHRYVYVERRPVYHYQDR